MKRMNFRMLIGLLLLNCLPAITLQASNRFIVRVNGGMQGIRVVCVLVGCNVAEGMDGPLAARV